RLYNIDKKSIVEVVAIDVAHNKRGRYRQ
ncbi:hypothetical protein Trydic_g4966, partial [Trypoxylus dichotomus]